MAIVRMNLTDIEQDEQYRVRPKINFVHLSRMKDKLEAGGELPPPIVAVKIGKRKLKQPVLVAGWHRVTAYAQVSGGAEVLIDVETREYANKAAIFTDALAADADHGQPLSPHDQDEAAVKAKAFGIPFERTAAIFGIPIDKLRRRVTYSGPARPVRGVFTDDAEEVQAPSEPIILKSDFKHLAGEPLSAEQVEVHDKSGGKSVAFYARQVTSRITSATVNWEAPSVIEALSELQDVLNESSELAEAREEREAS